ncbi:outer membrane protein assembly factor BamB family protein [Candidatus Venteria ishoeyi]|uniref:Outer membrane biogenesis protein BamB n=1 Tax=Candidatus Venteria ishoeyi TaxID=1899563 RepID=A0A1H6F767_9GAMM|nr:PQQ-binding-like beta-propeller repeat protein [Candidatus Venteria ishoeyi]SEH05383.1 outer membrane biogenesis protein BamB [Candidatus Venteria ishoeyi]
MKNKLFYLFIAAILCSCVSKEEKKITFEQWRGENRDGKYQEKDLLKSWPEEGPDLLWFNEELGAGYGSPIITDNTIYILASRDSIALIVAFDLAGNIKWQKDFGFEWNTSYAGTRSTPTLIDNLLYISSGKGDIACMKSENGEIVWSKNMESDFHGKLPYFGYAQSLLINDDMVYAMPGGADTNLVALNRFNGDLIWIAKANGEKPAYNSPQIIDLNGNQVLVTYSQESFLGIDAKKGKLLWSESFTSKYPNHANTILYDDRAIYTAASIGHGLLKYTLSDDGASITKIWHDTIVGNYFGGMIKLGDKLYSGGGSRSKYLLMMDANTGAIKDSLKTDNGSVIYADGMLYTYSHKRGKVCLVDAENFEIKGSFKVEKGTNEHFSHPVIKNGVLYIRHGNTLLAYDIKAKTE